MKLYPLLTADVLPVAIVLVNGDYPSHPLPLSLLERCGYVVCCDGAADEFILSGRIPAAIVGDGDSLSEANRVRFASILHPVAEQETNDQTKAVKFCVAHGKTSLMIMGATGKREDHTLGNISLLAEYMDTVSLCMVTDHGVFTPIFSDSCFESYPGQQVSIFAMEPTPVTTEGLRYPIHNRVLTNWWQGTLNEATGDHFTIRTNGKMIVFRAF